MLFDNIKKLCRERGISLSQLEENVGFGQNTIYKWKKQVPKVDKLQKVADYFDVSTDYLLGRTEKKYWELTEKDEQNISKKIEKMINDLSSADAIAFSKEGQEYDDDTRELLIMSLETSLRIAKQEAKRKFTPKKYRK